MGVAIRFSMNYDAFDLTLEGTFIAGLLGGNVVGLIVGCLVGVTALLNKEWLALPLFALFGLTSGILRNLCSNKEEIWSFSPFALINIFLSLRSQLLFKKVIWQLIIFFTCLTFDIQRYLIGQSFPKGWLFYLHPRSDTPLILMFIFAATLSCVGLVLKDLE